MKNLQKRLLSLALTAAMLLGLLPAVTPPAQATDDSRSTGLLTENEYEDLSTASDAERQNNPYGKTGWFNINPRRELSILRGGPKGIIPGAKKSPDVYDLFNYADEDLSEVVPGIRDGGYRKAGWEGTGESSPYLYLSSVAFDPTGCGQDNYLATIGYGRGDGTLYLSIIDASTGERKALHSMGTGTWYSHLKKLKSEQYKAFLSITAGDYNGDGRDSIFCYAPIMGGGLQPILQEYSVSVQYGTGGTVSSLKIQSASWSYKVLSELSALSHSSFMVTDDQARLQNTPQVALATGDLDRDGVDEVACVIGFNDLEGSETMRNRGELGSKLMVFERGTKNNNTIGSGNWQRTFARALSPGGTLTETGRLRFAGVSIGNVEPSGGVDFPEIVAAGSRDANSGSSRDGIGSAMAAYLFRCTGFENADLERRGVGMYTLARSDLTVTEMLQGTKAQGIRRQVGVECFAADGPGKPESVFVDGSVYSYVTDSDGFTTWTEHRMPWGGDFGGTWVSGVAAVSVLAGNFNGNEDGIEQLAFTSHYISNGEQGMNLVICGRNRDGTWYMSQVIDKNDKNKGYFLYTDAKPSDQCFADLAAPDIGQDATMAKIRARERTHTKPEVLAILEAMPYFDEINRGDVGNGGTVFSTTSTTGSGSSSSASFSIKAMFGYDYVDSVTQSGGGFEATFENVDTWTSSKTRTQSFTIEYYNDSGENQVVLFNIPAVNYIYDVVRPGGKAGHMVVTQMGQPVTEMISLNEYNLEAALPGSELEPITIRLGTPGNPVSYNTTLPSHKFPELSYQSGQASRFSAGTIKQTFSVEDTKEKSSDYAFNFSVDAYGQAGGFKFGGGVGGGYAMGKSDLKASEISKEAAVSGRPANASNDYDFNWRLATWAIELNGNPKGKSQVPVIGYLVDSVIAPPTPPLLPVVSDETSSSLTLLWENGKRAARSYNIYRYNPMNPTATYVKVGSTPGTAQEYTVTGLKPETTYQYVITAVGVLDGGRQVESVYSATAVGTTLPENGETADITITPKEHTAVIGETTTFSVTAQLPSRYSGGRNYLWQERQPGGNWTTSFRQGRDTSTLHISNITQAMDGMQVRCQIQAMESDYNAVTFYSPAATLHVGQAQTATSLKIADALGGDGSSAIPYMGLPSRMETVERTEDVRLPAIWTCSESDTIAHSIPAGEYEVVTPKTAGGQVQAEYLLGVHNEGDEESPQLTYIWFAPPASAYPDAFWSNDQMTEAQFNALEVGGKLTKSPYYRFSTFTWSLDAPSKEQGTRTVTGTPYKRWMHASEDISGRPSDNFSAELTEYVSKDDKFYLWDHETGKISSEAATDLQDKQLLPLVCTDNDNNPTQWVTLDNTKAGYYGWTTQSWTSADVSDIICLKDGEGGLISLIDPVLDQRVYLGTTTVSVEQFMEGTSLQLTPGLTRDGGTLKDQTVTVTISSVTDGSSNSYSVAPGKTVNWGATAPGLYAIRASYAGSQNFQGSSSETYYYLAAAADQFLYRVALFDGNTEITGATPYGKTLTAKVMEREVTYEMSNITYGNESESAKKFKFEVNGEDMPSSWTPDAGSYAITATETNAGAGATPVTASTSLTVTKAPIKLGLTWNNINDEKNNPPESLKDITVEVLEGKLVPESENWQQWFYIDSPLYTGGERDMTATGMFDISLTLNSTPPNSVIETYNKFLQNYSPTCVSTRVSIVGKTHTVKYRAHGQNGTVDGAYSDNEYTFQSGNALIEGIKVVLTAKPSSGYQLDLWMLVNPQNDTPEQIGADRPGFRRDGNKLIVDSLKSDLDIIATFQESGGHAVKFQSVGDGSLSATADGQALRTGDRVEQGRTVVFTAQPSTGMTVEKWIVDGQEHMHTSGPNDGTVYRGRTLTLDAISAPHEVTVYFKLSSTHKVSAGIFDDTGAAYTDATLTASNPSALGVPVNLDEVEVPDGSSLTFTVEPTTGKKLTIKRWQISTDNGVTFTTLPNAAGLATLTLESISENLVLQVIVGEEESFQVTWEVQNEDTTESQMASIRATAGGGDILSGSSQPGGSTIYLNATLEPGWEIVKWENATADPKNNAAATVENLSADTTVTLTVQPIPTVEIGYTVIGGGSLDISASYKGTDGVVETNGDSVKVYQGADVTVTPTANAGSHLTALTDGGESVLPLENGGYKIAAIDAGHILEATFTALIQNEVVFGAVGQGRVTAAATALMVEETGGTITSGTVVNSGNVIFTAAPHENHHLDHWMVNSAKVDPHPGDAYTHEMTGAVNVQAVFLPDLMEVSYGVADDGWGGDITAEGYGGSPAQVPYGGSIIFTAAPGLDYTVEGWYVDGVKQKINETDVIDTTQFTLAVTEPAEVEVKFARSESGTLYTVEYSATTGGSVAVTATHGTHDQVSKITDLPFNGTVTLRANPENLHTFTGWTVKEKGIDGDTHFKTPELTLTVRKDMTVAANFIPVALHRVTFSAGSDGNIAATANGGAISTNDLVAHGSTLVFTATPGQNKAVAGWTVNSQPQSARGNTYTISPLTGETDVRVIFGVQVTINITDPINGSISVQADGQTIKNSDTVAAGTTLSLTAKPHNGYKFSAWGDDAATLKSASGTLIVSDSGSLTISATFAEDNSGGGSIGGGGTPVTPPKDDNKTVIDDKTGDQLVADAEKNGGDIAISADKSAVSLPAGLLSDAGSKTNADILITTPVAAIRLPNGALGDLASLGGEITVQATLNKNAAGQQMLTLDITADGKPVGSVLGGVRVTVPYTGGSVNTVAMLENSGKVLPKSFALDEKMIVPLDGPAAVLLTNNPKYFHDIANHWGKEHIDFVTSHELFQGVEVGVFDADGDMTRAMMWTVLARLEGMDTATDGAWYQRGMEWAKATGISDGSDPGGSITREQLAAMLWRAAGEPQSDGSLDGFHDASEASDYALEALRWAVEQGILSGKGGGELDPSGNATRAEVAVMLQQFIQGKK